MQDLLQLLEQSSLRHSHLCPRQVLGVRMALTGASWLGMNLPRTDKEMMVISETDGCFLDGLEVATGFTPGHRTLRIEDYGKIAATFVVVKTGRALRLAPRPGVRQSASRYAPGETRHYFAQLLGYQAMPEDELFTASVVTLTPSAAEIISQPGIRTVCEQCGEEIINEREVVIAGKSYCQACCGRGYYFVEPVSEPLYKWDKVLAK
ncbi:MAG TPA: FmdE family protein [Bellilinea sp.]|nr:FmdE family protein [Bellilinea sp.]